MLEETNVYNIDGNQYKVTVVCNERKNQDNLLYDVFEQFCNKKIIEESKKS